MRGWEGTGSREHKNSPLAERGPISLLSDPWSRPLRELAELGWHELNVQVLGRGQSAVATAQKVQILPWCFLVTVLATPVIPALGRSGEDD